VGRDASFEGAHQVSEKVEQAIETLLPRADFMVHIDPVVRDDQNLVESIQSVAAHSQVKVHGIHVQDIQGKAWVAVHVEVPDDWTLKDAHKKATAFEKLLGAEIQRIDRVITHIEPIGLAPVEQEQRFKNSAKIEEIILQLVKEYKTITSCHSIIINRAGSEFSASFHCEIPPELSIREAHSVSAQLENEYTETSLSWIG
jgi:divalent metal cation (Fe/Co/Zn/Cd) transporter